MNRATLMATSHGGSTPLIGTNDRTLRARVHSRLAWSMAAVLGPQLVNYVSTYRIDHGVPRAEAYNATMYLMAGLLLVGLVCNLLVRPVDERFHHREAESLGHVG